ncbi:hypothetical protein ASF10_22150 [Flavobacterium sp. Leaf82]|jgi:external thioesterase TEII|uniref:thioesterase II family protein n=1 Tax=unclassified Flavobacterium TaxID=196869 RepID=UPI0006F8D2CA|nr:thioesterase domain-containing protein [Flavobacterium sp. Leaf82]KQO31342.1 hypothetical protein ASF10_22150 [Flavobacterium sp. Leaf82]
MEYQLFMLHFSGGSKYSFNLFTDKLKDFFSLEPVELPGRGLRFDEDLIYDKEKAVTDLLLQIRKKRNEKPFILYGHSLGAELGFLITKELEKVGDFPSYLVVSGNPGPNMRDNQKLYEIPNPSFFDKLKELGGLPKEILESEELREIFEPILRADFEIIEKDTIINAEKIKSPIFALMGNEERTVDKVENWKNYTESSFDFNILPGNHFFIYENKDKICDILINCKAK